MLTYSKKTSFSTKEPLEASHGKRNLSQSILHDFLQEILDLEKH
jgi:hypothetical protein